MKARVIGSLAVLALVAGVTFAEKKEVDWAKIKCIVSGKPVNKEVAVDYKEGKVYLCCENCPKAFTEAKEKFAAKANHQLVATQQFVQAKCPLSGRDLNPEAKVKVADIEVQLCCNNCQKRVAEAKGEEQLNLVFADAAFKKGFKKAEKEEEGAK